MLRRTLQVLLAAIVVLAGVFIAAGKGWLGSHEGPGEVLETRRSAERVVHTERAVADAASAIERDTEDGWNPTGVQVADYGHSTEAAMRAELEAAAVASGDDANDTDVAAEIEAALSSMVQ